MAALKLTIPPVVASNAGVSLTARDRMVSARAEAKALFKAERKDPTEMPKPLFVEQLLSAQVRYIGTADRAEKYAIKDEATKRASDSDLTRAELARQKLAEAKLLEKEERERPTEMPKPLIVEQLLSARIRYVGTANRAEKFVKRKMDEPDEAAKEAAAVEDQIRAREEAVVRMQAVHRGKSARSMPAKASGEPMAIDLVDPPVANEVGKQVENFFGWVAQLGQQQKTQERRPTTSMPTGMGAGGEVHQLV